MKQTDCRGNKIDYDAPGQLGRHSPPAQKLPRVPRFRRQLDRLVAYHKERGHGNRALHVTLAQLRELCGVPPDQVNWKPSGDENYHGHPLVVTEEP